MSTRQCESINWRFKSLSTYLKKTEQGTYKDAKSKTKDTFMDTKSQTQYHKNQLLTKFDSFFTFPNNYKYQQE